MWVLAIFAGSTIPGQYIPVIPYIHLAAHVTEYSVLGALIIMWLTHSRPRAYPLQISLFVLVLIAGVATLDEWYQTSVPGRSGEFSTILLDVLYAAAGIAIWDFFTKNHRTPLRRHSFHSRHLSHGPERHHHGTHGVMKRHDSARGPRDPHEGYR